MKWIVGLDMLPSSHGALQFAAWLREASQADDGETLHGVHVLEKRRVESLLPHATLLEVERQANLLLAEALEASKTDPEHVATKLAHGETADAAIEEALRSEKAEGIIVGRQAGKHEARFVRLGRVARRLVRNLPAPVFVVPPDLERKDIGSGPVLLATSLDDDSKHAAAFARRMAERVGRPLVVVHIVPGFDDSNAVFVPAVTRDQLFRQLELDGRRDLEAWLDAERIEPAARVVATGDVVYRLTAIAQQEEAAFIVCGSRHLGLGRRLFTSSVGTDLASAAACAVAVVPSHE